MSVNNSVNAYRVFEIFKDISEIPRGSGNMTAIADYCVAFANKNGLKFIRDNENNIIIFKNGNKGLENAEPVILQGHLDMVCQQMADSTHDFEVMGPAIMFDGDFIKANGTTLGADNGIAVAMVMAILESNDIKHPPIEAVFTIDEEIGMIGAIALDCSSLKANRMINLDSEEDDTVTVSCAGGSEFKVTVAVNRQVKQGTQVSLTVSGLQGGHSGVEIDKGRVNANILAGRILNHLKKSNNFDIININGGDKSNAITPVCTIEICTDNAEEFSNKAEEYLISLKNEISSREPDFAPEIKMGLQGEYATIGSDLTERLIFFLVSAPNGIVDMSAEIEGLVETSLNLGILETKTDEITIDFSLRSNKVTALKFLEEKLNTFSKCIDGEVETFGHYPPWEFKANSELQKLYIKSYKEFYGKKPKVEAIHAGLECGVFSSKIKNLDCIAVGPSMYDVHTVKEKLSISSTESFFAHLIKVLGELS